MPIAQGQIYDVYHTFVRETLRLQYNKIAVIHIFCGLPINQFLINGPYAVLQLSAFSSAWRCVYRNNSERESEIRRKFRRRRYSGY